MGRTPLPPDATPLKRLARFAFMGYEMLAWMLMSGLIGAGVDWVLGTRPWLMVIGLVAGLAVGVGRFLRDAMRLTQDTPEDGE